MNSANKNNLEIIIKMLFFELNFKYISIKFIIDSYEFKLLDIVMIEQIFKLWNLVNFDLHTFIINIIILILISVFNVVPKNWPA